MRSVESIVSALTQINANLWLDKVIFWGILCPKWYFNRQRKIAVIATLPQPLNAKGFQVFMGHCGYYHRFIYMYVAIARPLYALLAVFEWTDDWEVTFEKLKMALVTAPILQAPNWAEIFSRAHRCIDICNGCILTQPGEKNTNFPISYASCQLNSAEKKLHNNKT